MNTKTNNNRTKSNNKHSNGRNNKQIRKSNPESQKTTFANTNVAKSDFGDFKDGSFVSGSNSTSVVNPIELERQQKFSTLPKPVDVQISPEPAFHRNPSPPGLLSPSHFSNPHLNNQSVPVNNPPATLRSAPSAPQLKYIPIDPQSLFNHQPFQFAPVHSVSPPKPIAVPSSPANSSSVQAQSPSKSPTRSYSIQGSPGLHFAGGSYTNAPDPRMVSKPAFMMSVPS